MEDECDKKLQKFALQSRFVVFMIQLISNAVIPDHDPGNVFNPPHISEHEDTFLDKLVYMYLGGFKRWDGHYFLHITESGYIYQNSLAFFPLFPWSVRIIANTLLFPLQYVINYHSIILFAAWLLNTYLFIKAASLLYRLGKKTLGDAAISYKAALLFCVNPASIFMSAAYSETIYAFLVFQGLLCFEEQKRVAACFVFSLANLTRSNGLINFGFEAYLTFKSFVQELRQMRNVMSSNESARTTGFKAILFIRIVSLTFLFLVFILPYLLYQFYLYKIFCIEYAEKKGIAAKLVSYGRYQGYLIVGDAKPTWCNNSLPLSYGFVQESHWGLGFLQYYEIKQIPNFLLALPVTLLSLASIMCYCKKNRRTCLTLGLADSKQTSKKEEEEMDYGYVNKKLLPYVVQILFLTVFGWFYMHIQVITRLLFSSSPLLYWYAAYITTKETPRSKFNRYDVVHKREELISVETEKNLNHPIKNQLTDQIVGFNNQIFVTKLILIYFCGYFVIGIVAFSNFLPWT